ncbi:MAG: hypothetical protein NZ898_10785 [Myxococcota bacterium]|nr:hypothetical protein [Myxococcota bacterium]MDW8363440.1 hypothetical protein [Myxococcales bacterium]
MGRTDFQCRVRGSSFPDEVATSPHALSNQVRDARYLAERLSGDGFVDRETICEARRLLNELESRPIVLTSRGPGSSGTDLQDIAMAVDALRRALERRLAREPWLAGASPPVDVVAPPASRPSAAPSQPEQTARMLVGLFRRGPDALDNWSTSTADLRNLAQLPQRTFDEQLRAAGIEGPARDQALDRLARRVGYQILNRAVDSAMRRLDDVERQLHRVRLDEPWNPSRDPRVAMIRGLVGHDDFDAAMRDVVDAFADGAHDPATRPERAQRVAALQRELLDDALDELRQLRSAMREYGETTVLRNDARELYRLIPNMVAEQLVILGVPRDQADAAARGRTTSGGSALAAVVARDVQLVQSGDPDPIGDIVDFGARHFGRFGTLYRVFRAVTDAIGAGQRADHAGSAEAVGLGAHAEEARLEAERARNDLYREAADAALGGVVGRVFRAQPPAVEGLGERIGRGVLEGTSRTIEEATSRLERRQREAAAEEARRTGGLDAVREAQSGQPARALTGVGVRHAADTVEHLAARTLDAPHLGGLRIAAQGVELLLAVRDRSRQDD